MAVPVLQQQYHQQHQRQQEPQAQAPAQPVAQPVVQPHHPLPQSQHQPRSQAVDSDGFTVVTGARKKNTRKKLEVKGVNSSTALKGVAPPTRKLDLFVGRLDLSTTSEAVELHENWVLQGSGKATVLEIPHCAAAYGYRGFRVTVPADAASLVLRPDKWPSHVSVKRFFQPKGDKGTGSSLDAKRSTSQPKLLTRSTPFCVTGWPIVDNQLNSTFGNRHSLQPIGGIHYWLAYQQKRLNSNWPFCITLRQ